MTNQGFEFTLTTQNVNHKKFGWTTTVNFDTNKTRLISLGGQERYFPVSQNYGSFSGQEIAASLSENLSEWCTVMSGTAITSFRTSTGPIPIRGPVSIPRSLPRKI